MIPGSVARAYELAGRDQPRSGHVALVDRTTEVRPDGGAQALGGRDAGLEHLSCFAGGAQRPVGLPLRRQCANVVRRHAEEMHVRIDHAGHDRLIASVDHHGVGRCLKRVAMADLVNSAVQDQKRHVFPRRRAGSIQHAPCAQDGRLFVVRHCLAPPVVHTGSGLRTGGSEERPVRCTSVDSVLALPPAAWPFLSTLPLTSADRYRLAGKSLQHRA